MKKLVAVILGITLMSFTFAMAQAPAAGTTFTVTLSENPTTGFTWKVTNSDEAILTVTDNGYAPLPSLEEGEGAGGTRTWVVSGKTAGEATLAFTCAQDWEGGESYGSFTYTCNVDAALTVTVTKEEGTPEMYMPNKEAVLLLENPTTGFTWAYEASADGILTFEKDEYIALNADADGTTPLGAGGYHVWIFTGTAEGDVTLTFKYAKSWETGVEPEATVTYDCHVDSALNVTETQVGGDIEKYDPYMIFNTQQ